MPPLPVMQMAQSLVVTAVVLVLFAGFVWWRIDHLERYLSKRMDENRDSSAAERKEMRDKLSEILPRVERLDVEFEGVRREVTDITRKVDRLQVQVTNRGV